MRLTPRLAHAAPLPRRPTRRAAWLAALGLVALLMAQGCPKPPPEAPVVPENGHRGGPPGSGQRHRANTGNALVGQELYQRRCRQCHGTTEMPVDTALSLLARTDPDRALQVILEGTEEMPAFGNRMPQQLLEDVVLYLKVADPHGDLSALPRR